MARVLAKTGLKIALESKAGEFVEPTEVIKITSNITPKIKLDEVEIPNFSFYGGTKDVLTIADWGQMEIEASTCLYPDLKMFESLFAMCNLKVKSNDDANTVFVPDTHGTKTGSVSLILPDRRFLGAGAKASFSMSAKVADKIEVKFNIKAAFCGEDIAPQTFEDTKAQRPLYIARDMQMSMDNEEINLSEFSFEMGNEINYEKFTNIGEFHMSDYAPKITLKTRLESGKESGFEAFAHGKVFTNFIASFTESGSSRGFVLKIPTLKVAKTPEFVDLDGIYVLEREFIALSDKGDDNFELIYNKM